MDRAQLKEDGNASVPQAEAKASNSVELALVQSQAVQEKIGECADDLSLTKQSVHSTLEQGANLLAALEVLVKADPAHDKVLECVEELHSVNETLSQGMSSLERTEAALEESRASLAASQLALSQALDEIKQVRDLALQDGLTGLPNRELFMDRLGYAIALARRREWNLAVMFLDLDGFKAINDNFGHAAGDEVLTQTAKRLTRKLRFADTVCRYGGDEFVLMLVNPQAQANIERIANEVLAELAAPIPFGEASLEIGASLGIAIYPDHGQERTELIQQADAAMYVAKKAKSRIAFS